MTRADCAHCEGHSRGTVSFTAEMAFCHRCKWRANAVTLARELGLLQGNPQAVSAFREKARRRVHLEAEIKPFEVWREARIREVSDRYRALSRTAVRAEEILSKFPDCAEAWNALAARGSYRTTGYLLQVSAIVCREVTLMRTSGEFGMRSPLTTTLFP